MNIRKNRKFTPLFADAFGKGTGLPTDSTEDTVDLTLCTIILPLPVLSGGGDTFDCYEDQVIGEDGLPEGEASWSGGWTIFDSPLRYPKIDDFESYSLGAAAGQVLNGGDGFDVPWVVSS